MKKKRSNGLTTHGMSYSSEYRIWRGIKTRCLNVNDKAYPLYGGKGIGIDERWLSFKNFFEDMGKRPSGLTIERRNNKLGYSKSNCYWGSRKEQTDNRNYTVWLEHDGIRLPQADWARRLKITPASLAYRRIQKGETISQIVNHFSQKTK